MPGLGFLTKVRTEGECNRPLSPVLVKPRSNRPPLLSIEGKSPMVVTQSQLGLTAKGKCIMVYKWNKTQMAIVRLIEDNLAFTLNHPEKLKELTLYARNKQYRTIRVGVQRGSGKSWLIPTLKATLFVSDRVLVISGTKEHKRTVEGYAKALLNDPRAIGDKSLWHATFWTSVHTDNMDKKLAEADVVIMDGMDFIDNAVLEHVWNHFNGKLILVIH
jgi:hypothetical protein